MTPLSGSVYGFKSHTRFLEKHAKEGFAIFEAAMVAGIMSNEVPSHLLEALVE
jgi:hypothetical protein